MSPQGKRSAVTRKKVEEALAWWEAFHALAPEGTPVPTPAPTAQLPAEHAVS